MRLRAFSSSAWLRNKLSSEYLVGSEPRLLRWDGDGICKAKTCHRRAGALHDPDLHVRSPRFRSLRFRSIRPSHTTVGMRPWALRVLLLDVYSRLHAREDHTNIPDEKCSLFGNTHACIARVLDLCPTRCSELYQRSTIDRQHHDDHSWRGSECSLLESAFL
jgi:hypothetical protein